MKRDSQHIDGYRLLRPLATGERFTVYRASARDGDVALKVAQNRSALDLAYLRREREVTLHLGAPGLRQVLAVGQSAEGFSYSALQFGERTLRDEMARKGRFSRDEVIRLLTPVAETLDEIHSQQYVHGAVTPEHIVFAGGGVPLLAGLAHARRRGQTPDKADPRYSAPELAEGQPVGPWCDTYSLGVIAYEMLTGESPFSAKSPEEWQRARAAQAPDIPAATKRLLGGDATRALLRALAKEPGDRFHSVTAFVEALKEEEPTSLRLRRVFTDLGQGARTAGKRAPRFAKVMLLALVILAGAAGVAYSGARRSEAPPEDPRTATAAFVAALQTPDTIWTPRPLHSPSPSATFDPAAATVEAGTTRVVVTATAATATTPTSTPSVPTATPPPVRPDTLHPAPTLVEPADVTRFPADGAVDLIWEYGRALEPGESFDIRMWKNGEPAWGIARSTSTRYRLSGPPKGVGEYNWLIVVVRDDPETGQPVETSGRSATRRVSWG